ncbi:HlyD family secretion protein [Pseudoxanthomonas dokdonensis]|uniref:Hemolysin secretion protein D n=1 Tax=Pseudoxanthomonas dokdonensis TaxID=344882 RepID=A0A0R0CJR5_9GAMM|nr:HlyD family efflux transporter periplasmic adaptor subunit [Pseudoxanthomonas dokdonensis]KRG69776.1 hemolysin secretion protein D [Pseudoxanthomonas dokdonensis]
MTISSPRPLLARGGLPLLAALALAACSPSPPQALGTLEWDRVTLPSPAAEKIVRIDVREGQQVQAGAPLLQLELTRDDSQLAAAQAQLLQNQQRLDELQNGPRQEDIAQARANLAAARARALEADTYYRRIVPLGRQQLVAAADVDTARSAKQSADAQVGVAQAALDELLAGTRREQIAQGRAAVLSAQAQARLQAATRDKLIVTAPRAGRVDSLPYRLGDQAPLGSPLAVLLVGDTPYARVYVPEQQRADVQVGDPVRIFVDGRDAALAGKVRMIRSEPSFTPYYALIGKDAARLSYIAEISLGRDAANLPAGFPLRAEFGPARDD